MKVRVLIVDDEPPARARVHAMLAAHDQCEVIGEAGDGADAADTILRESPDLVFLDIKMPELDGFEVIEALAALEGSTPAIVFVTAFDQYALKAFEVGALDYLLKPFDQTRFDKALQSALDKVAVRRLRRAEGLGTGSIDAALEQMLQSTGRKYERPVRFLVRRGRQMQFVRADTIDWLEAQGNYVELHISGRTHLLRDTMTAMEQKLDPALFVRVHRSIIVNIDRVSTIEPHVHGEYEITMRDGARMKTSAAHSARLRGMLR